MNHQTNDLGKITSAKYRLTPHEAAIIRTNPPANLTVMEAAAYIRCSPRKLRDLIKEQRVTAVRIGAKIILRREYLDELVRGHCDCPNKTTPPVGETGGCSAPPV